MSGLIAMDTGLRRGRGIYVRWTDCFSMENMLGRPEKLCGFEYHLDNMLVAMPLRCDGGDRVKKEDVHPATWWPRHLCNQVFAAIRRG